MGKDIKESLLYLPIWIFVCVCLAVMKIERNDQCADSRKKSKTALSSSSRLASQLFPPLPSLSPSFALKWKVNVIGHTEAEQCLPVVANNLLSLSVKEELLQDLHPQ